MSENPSTAYRGRVKYDEQTARKYQVRKSGKHQAEMRLADRAVVLVPCSHRVLDLPCGGGRLTLHLARQGYAVTAADLSDSMLEITRENVTRNKLHCRVEKQDIERLTFADREFDTVISFRLFHHFPTREIRRRTVNELCRVARKYVLLSYFSPLSLTSAKRKLRAVVGGRRSDRYATPLREVREYFAASGFRLMKDFAQLPLIHTLHLALFERVGETKP